MKIDYCDLCGTPLKEDAMWILYLSPPRNTQFNDETYSDYLKRIERGSKEICSTCKLIFDKIFELRLENLKCLANELFGIYSLPPYEGKKKNGKNKK